MLSQYFSIHLACAIMCFDGSIIKHNMTPLWSGITIEKSYRQYAEMIDNYPRLYNKVINCFPQNAVLERPEMP